MLRAYFGMNPPEPPMPCDTAALASASSAAPTPAAPPPPFFSAPDMLFPVVTTARIVNTVAMEPCLNAARQSRYHEFTRLGRCNSTHLLGRPAKWSSRRLTTCSGSQTEHFSSEIHSSRVAGTSSLPSVVILKAPVK